MRRVAEPIVADLNRTTGETVFLAELVGKQVVCFAIVQGTRLLRLFVDLGRALPLHAAASARVMLAHLDEASVAGLLVTRTSGNGHPRPLSIAPPWCDTLPWSAIADSTFATTKCRTMNGR